MTCIAITSFLIGSLVATIAQATEEFFLETPDLVRRHGYPVETHKVTTEDGYILTVHRIPYAKNSTHGVPRPAVVLMHGILGSSAEWLILGRHNGYGYVLANSGYDVWLPNGRGNIYSREHVSLSTNETAFWNFSWHENGIYDLPAVIDYILKQNGQSKLFYVGYSMGSTMFYVMASEKPEYNEKIRAMVSLAPVAYMKHIRSPALQLLARTSSYLTFALDLLGQKEIPPIPNFIRAVSITLCKEKELQVHCTALLGSLIDASYLNKSSISTLLGHLGSGASIKQCLHYLQIIRNGRFQKYDYGYLGNMLRYGKSEPPDYNLDKITTAVTLIHSEKDWLSIPLDVERLYKELHNPIRIYKIPLKNFKHADFMWGSTAKQMAFQKSIEFMNVF